MAGPSICVAVPVKNGSKFLPAAIESILAQEDVDLTVHVVDNLSDDDSVEIARRYESDGRVQVDINRRDVKYYGSLNRILSEATADYFVPFAADDVMLPGNLSRKLQAIQETGAGMAHSPAMMIDEEGRPTGVWPDHSQTPVVLDPPWFFPRTVPHNQVSTNAAVVRTDALRAIGGFDARSLYAGDWLTFMRLALRLRVFTMNEPLVGYRDHADAGRSYNAHIKGRDLPATLDQIFLDDAMPPDWIDQRDQLMAAHLIELAIPLHREGIDTIAKGWGAYMTMGRRLSRMPLDSTAIEDYRQFIVAARLSPPDLPLEAIACAPEDPEDAAALAGGAEELAGRLARLIVCAHPDRVEQAMTLLEPHFGDTALDVELVPTSDHLRLISPSRIVLAPWGSELITQSEDRGVPVYPYAIPNPFDRRPDPALWETVDLEACLP